MREVIFVEGQLSYAAIINHIQQLPRNVFVRFHASGSASIVGSDSKDASGEFVSVDGIYQLSDPYQKRMKRIVDICLAVFIIITFPIQIIICGFRVMYNALAVLSGSKTWIGFSADNKTLPLLPKGILTASGMPVAQGAATDQAHLDEWYARQYNWTNDLKIIYRNYRKLGA